MSEKSRENRILFICWLVYAAAYVGRLNYSASIVAVINDLGVTKAEAGLVSSFFFFAYGVGQLVNGILTRKYNSRIMVFLSLMVSSLINLIMPLSGDITLMKYIWLINGAVQSVLWCTLIKTISENVSEENMPKAVFVMSTPTAAGTFIVYGMSALFVKFFTWKITFYTASFVLFISAIVWFTVYGKSKRPAVAGSDDVDIAVSEKIRITGPMLIVVITIAVAGIANGFIKDGINTWVPNVLYEEFGVSESLSIFLTLFLPLIAMAGAGIVKKIHEKIKSLSMLDLIFYILSAVMCGAVLLALRLKAVVFIMAAFIVVACLMAMVNNVITSIFALENRKHLNSGFSAGLLNTFCYVGSTITSYSLGAVSQARGWNSAFLIMVAVSAVAAVSSALGSYFERKLKI